MIGDVIGSVFEFDNCRTKDFILFGSRNRMTDDSIMTLAVMEIMQKKLYHDRDKIIDTFKKWGRAYPRRGYGGMFRNWLFSDMRESYNSYGNGAAMRISPVGYYAKSEEEVIEISRKITEVTHSHPEGIKGAEVTAMCIYYAKIGKSKEFIKEYVSRNYDLDFDYEWLNSHYQFNETCQGTVPQAVYCFLISNDYEDCIRTTISIGGDSDTLAAISGAIAEAYYKHINAYILGEFLYYIPKENAGCDPTKVVSDYIYYNSSILCSSEIIENDTKILSIIENNTVHFNYSKQLKALIGCAIELIVDKKSSITTEEFRDLIEKLFYVNSIESANKVLEDYCKEKIEDFSLIIYSNPIEALSMLQNSNCGTSTKFYEEIFNNSYKIITE